VTFIGKILTGLTLVLSILFASLSVVVFATHRNWRDESKKLETSVTELTNANTRLREDIQRSKDEYAREQLARKMAIASLETQLQTAVDLAKRAKDESDSLNAQIGTLVSKGNTDSTQLAAVTSEVSELRTQLRDSRADRDSQFAEATRLTDEVHGLQGVKDTLTAKNVQLAASNARFQKVLEANNLTEFDEVESIPPKVDGIVVAVAERDLIEVSLGADDGLKIGHTLDVHRGAVYLGRVVIKQTSPNRAVAQVLPEFRKGLIRTNDRVATRFVN